jgi:hypothetical protein
MLLLRQIHTISTAKPHKNACLSPVVVGLMSYLCYLCLFAIVVSNTYCVVFLFGLSSFCVPMLPVSLDYPFSKMLMIKAGVTYSFFPLLIFPPGKISIYSSFPLIFRGEIWVYTEARSKLFYCIIYRSSIWSSRTLIKIKVTISETL